MMAQPIFVKVTLHPALHMVMTKRRECAARPGMMWAVRARLGRDGRSSVHVWVDDTRSPLGRHAMSRTTAGRMLVAGAANVRKWLVAPESRIAHSLIVSVSVLIVFNNTESG
jgi:hypothetical protein